MAVACDITTASIYSPKHLVIWIYWYHKFKNRNLFEDMYSFGYCISYFEIYKFITSAATFICTTQNITKSGGIVSPEI